MGFDRVDALTGAGGAKETLLRADGRVNHDGGRTTATHLDVAGSWLNVEIHRTGHA